MSSAGPAGNTRAKKKQIYFYTEVFEARVCKLKCTRSRTDVSQEGTGTHWEMHPLFMRTEITVQGLLIGH